MKQNKEIERVLTLLDDDLVWGLDEMIDDSGTYWFLLDSGLWDSYLVDNWFE